MNPLMELKERLVYSTVAGTNLLSEDFRLKKAMEGFAPLAQKNPVFQKIYTDLQQLLTAEPSKQGVLMLNLLGLLDAVLYTQAGCGAEGESKIYEKRLTVGNAEQVRYSEIKPILEALTTTGSGRMEVLTKTIEFSPDILKDYRILHALVNDLDDAYAEMGDLVKRLLYAMGKGEPVQLSLNWEPHQHPVPKIDKEQLIAMLKEDFDPAGKRVMAVRLALVSELAEAEENDWYLSMLDTAKKDVRVQLMAALRYDTNNIDLLLQLCQKERGKSKEVVLRSLAKHKIPNQTEFWRKELEKNSESVNYLRYNQEDDISDMIAEMLKEKLIVCLQNEEWNDEISAWMYATSNKTSDKMLELYHWILKQGKAFNKLKIKSTKTVQHVADRLHYVLASAINATLQSDKADIMVKFLGSLSPTEKNGVQFPCFVADLLNRSAKEVYDIWVENAKADSDKKPYAVNVDVPSLKNWLQNVQYRNGNYYVVCTETVETSLLYDVPHNVLKEIKEPLDLRWYDLMMENNWNQVLMNLIPNQPQEFVDKIGGHFRKCALDAPWKGIRSASEAFNAAYLCLRGMEKTGVKDYQGVGLSFCRSCPQAISNYLIWYMERFAEFAGPETTNAEAEAIIKFYEESYQGGFGVQTLKRQFTEKGILKG